MSSLAKAEKRGGKGRGKKESRQVGEPNEDPPSDAASRRITENRKRGRRRKNGKKSREAASGHDVVDGEADGTASRIDATCQKSRKNSRKNHRSNISIDSDTDDDGDDDPPSSSEDEDDRPGAHAIAGGRGSNIESNSTNATNIEDGDEEVIVAVGAKLVEEDVERERIADEIKDEIYRTAVVGEATAMPNDRKTCWTIVGVFVVAVAIVGIVVGLVLGLAETPQSTQEPTESMMPTITPSPTSWPSSPPTVTPKPSVSPAPSSFPSVEPTISIQPSSFPTSVYDMEYGLSVGRSPIRYSGLNATIRCLLGFSCEYQAYGFDFIFRPRTSAFVSAIVCGINNDSFRFVVYDYSCGFIPRVDPTNSSCWYYSFYAESPPGSNQRYNVTPMLPLSPSWYDIDTENIPPQTELGDFTLELVDNDECFYAHIIDDTSSFLGVNFTYTTEEATAEDGLEITCTGSPSASSPGVWYKLKGTGRLMTASTCSERTNFDTQLSVFQGDSCLQLECIATNNDACGEQSLVQWPSIKDQIYYILVRGGSDGAVGTFELQIRNEIERISNDFCLSAHPLDRSHFTVSFFGATKDIEMPHHCAFGNDNIPENTNGYVGTVWYSLTEESVQDWGLELENYVSISLEDPICIDGNPCCSTLSVSLQIFDGSCGSLECKAHTNKKDVLEGGCSFNDDEVDFHYYKASCGESLCNGGDSDTLEHIFLYNPSETPYHIALSLWTSDTSVPVCTSLLDVYMHVFDARNIGFEGEDFLPYSTIVPFYTFTTNVSSIQDTCGVESLSGTSGEQLISSVWFGYGDVGHLEDYDYDYDHYIPHSDEIARFSGNLKLDLWYACSPHDTSPENLVGVSIFDDVAECNNGSIIIDCDNLTCRHQDSVATVKNCFDVGSSSCYCTHKYEIRSDSQFILRLWTRSIPMEVSMMIDYLKEEEETLIIT